MKRHTCLPKHLTDDELIEWLKLNAVETFTDTQKHYFKPEEIAEFEHESSVNGREFNRLKDLVKKVSEAVTKGNLDEPLVVTIPVTLGTKILETQRRQNDDDIERGYEETTVSVFAIPSAETETMEFFTDEGKHIADRSREMSMREKNQYVGLLQMAGRGGKIEVQDNGDVADTETGEVFDKTGTDNE